MRCNLALPIHIQREPDVACLRESLGLITRMLVVAPPLMDDQHSGTWPLRRVIPGNESLENRPAIFVFDFSRLNFSGSNRRNQEHRCSQRHNVCPIHRSLSQIYTQSQETLKLYDDHNVRGGENGS